MAEIIDELKKKHSSSKRKLTVLLNKLKTPEFKTHYLSSVTEYFNLVDLDLKVIELEGKDSTYLNDVTTSYESV